MNAFGVADSAIVGEAFFARNTVAVARDLVGKLLLSCAGGVLTGGRIVETEAYLGRDDPGSHASTKGITSRNAVMYGPPGRAYVYFTYGNHHMVNLVTEAPGTAGAVLVRAIEPLVGMEEMRRRRSGRPMSDLTNGPGKVAQALGIDLRDNDTVLGVSRLAVASDEQPQGRIAKSGRIGLSAGHELSLRFYLEGSAHVSKGRPGHAAGRRTRYHGDGPRRSSGREGREDG